MNHNGGGPVSSEEAKAAYSRALSEFLRARPGPGMERARAKVEKAWSEWKGAGA